MIRLRVLGFFVLTVLLLGLTMDPPRRLGSEAEANAWLDSVAAAYVQSARISLSSGGGPTGSRAGGGPVAKSEEFTKFQAAQREFAKQQVRLCMRYLDLDTRAGHRAADVEKGNVAALRMKLDAIAREHGDTC
jgi:fatty acid synthase subunit alpha